MHIREAVIEDIENGLVDTLKSLAETEFDPSFYQIFYRRSYRDIKTFVVIIDDKVVGTGSLWLEPKYIHNGSIVAHVEDVATHIDHRHKGIGRLVMETLEAEAKKAKAYKIILDCSEKNVPFYESLGYKLKEMQMREGLMYLVTLIGARGHVLKNALKIVKSYEKCYFKWTFYKKQKIKSVVVLYWTGGSMKVHSKYSTGDDNVFLRGEILEFTLEFTKERQLTFNFEGVL